MRVVKPYVLHSTLKIIYYSYFHSVMRYGLIFWGSSAESIKIFRLQNRIIRIMMGYKRNQSCRELFYKLGILSLPSQYIFNLLIFLNKNKSITNLEIHSHNTRQHKNFHQPSVRLAKCQKGVDYLGV